MSVNIINKSAFLADISQYDVLFIDPPFELFKEVSNDILPKIKKNQRVVIITNFQNREYITNILGTPRIELIWCFNNGSWVSHKMPQLCHENILIYGDTNDCYKGSENDIEKDTFKTSSIGRWSNGEKVKVNHREKKQLKTFIVANKNGWKKPAELIRPIIEMVCYNNAHVLDMFGGEGGILDILLDYNLSVDCYEIKESLCNELNNICTQPRLFKLDIDINDKIKDFKQNAEWI